MQAQQGKATGFMFHQKVEDNVNELKMTTAEEEAYARLETLFQPPINGFVESLKALIFTEDGEQKLVRGATDERVNIDDVLSTETVFVLVSDLGITEEQIERIRKDQYYPLLWIPIAYEGDNRNKANFDKMSGMAATNWYVAKYVSSETSIKFIRNEWLVDSPFNLLLINKWGVSKWDPLIKSKCGEAAPIWFLCAEPLPWSVDSPSRSVSLPNNDEGEAGVSRQKTTNEKDKRSASGKKENRKNKLWAPGRKHSPRSPEGETMCSIC